MDAEPVGLGSQITGTKTLTGIVYGLGAEGFVLPNVSLRLEALQYDYSMDDDRLQPYADFNETVVRAGLTIHLNYNGRVSDPAFLSCDRRLTPA